MTEAESELSSPPGSNVHRSAHRDAIISWSTLAVGAAVLAFLFRYNHGTVAVWITDRYGPTRTWDEYLLVNIGSLVFPPVLLLLCVLRQPPSRFGMRVPRRGSAAVAWIFLAAMAPVVWIVSLRPEFRAFYPLQGQAARAWGYFLWFELSYGFYLFCWEWFFRGFLTFGLARTFGAVTAVAIQASGFGVMHLGKPPVEFASSFAGGAILGWLALRTRSFVPGFWVHWSIAVALDCLAIHAKPGAIF